MSESILNRISKLRRQLTGKSFEMSARTYFEHYFHCKEAIFHKELYKILGNMPYKRSKRLAIAAPRESAKSTIVSLIYVLWCVCHKLEPYIVILSSTKNQAEDLLSHIRYEIRQNTRLINDFPDACEPPNPRWRKDEIITKNGVKITASSIGHEIRGKRHKEDRPTLIILDDIEHTENTYSSEAREKLFDWFTKDILKLGSKRTNFVVVGTIHHYDSLLSQLTSEEHFPGWVKKIFKSVISWSLHPELWDKWIQIFRGREEYKGKTGPDAASRFFKDNEQKMLEGTKVLWPERESYYDLMVIRERDGYSSFDSEKQNEPIDQNTALFPAKDIVYWDSKFPSEKELEEFLGKYKIVLGACDPSMGIGKHSDLSAIITVWMDGRGRDGKLYVIDADIGRWKPNELKERILFHHRRRKFDRFGYEANGFQQVIGDDIVKESDREGIHIPMEFIKNSINKYIRISRLQPLIQQGRLQFSKEHSELIAQLIHYPKGTHDDGPDALSIILDVAEKVAKFDTQKMLEVFKTLGAPVTGKNSKKIISVGGRSFDDPFGLLSP